MDGIVDSGILKYRSIIAKISVAYADLAPEVKMTLIVSFRQCMYDTVDSPNEYRFFDTELTRIELEAQESSLSPDHPFASQQVPKGIRHQNDKVRRE
jgi:hypothetical protein